MSLSSGSQNQNGPNFNNVGGGSRQQDQRQHQNMRQNFDNDSEDLNRQFNSRPSERPQASDSWSRYESEGGYDSSKYRTGPPPSSSSTTSRTEEQMRTGQMGGVGIMGAASSSSTSMGGGFMGGREGSTGMGNGMMGLEGKSHQGYRSSGPPPSLGGTTSRPSNMGGASSISGNGAAMLGATSMSGSGVPMMGGAPIISEGRRGAMGASGGLPLDHQARGGSFQQGAPNLGQPPPSDARAGQTWAGEQHRQQGGVSSSSMAPISYPPPSSSGASLASFPPPGFSNNFPPPTSTMPPATSRPPTGFNAGGSSSGFNSGTASFNRPAGGHGGAGGYDSSKYGRARNKPN